MLDMNSPKNDPPLKMGTPRFVGRVHLARTSVKNMASNNLACLKQSCMGSKCTLSWQLTTSAI